MNEIKIADSKLVEDILNGDIEKFAILVGRYERLLFSYLISKKCKLQEAEDIVQDSFIKAFKHLRSFDKNRKLSNWLLTITRNLMIDHLRQSGKFVSTTELVADFINFENISELENKPQDSVIKKEKFRKIVEMVFSLPEDLRIPFLMRIVNEKSYQEISDDLGLPLQTVKNRIFKARKLLKEQRNKLK